MNYENLSIYFFLLKIRHKKYWKSFPWHSYIQNSRNIAQHHLYVWELAREHEPQSVKWCALQDSF